MKKIILSFVALCLMCVNANARDYRTSGYMGFVEDATVTDFNKNTFGGINTTHGYQINQHFFVGAGAGIMVNYKKTDIIGVPIYGDFRYTILKSKVTPFFEAKCGYSVADIKGFYVSPTLGVDIAFTEKFGLYAALAYENYGKAKTKTYGKGRSLSTMAVRVGIHF